MERVQNALAKLGTEFKQYLNGDISQDLEKQYLDHIHKAYARNNWFYPQFCEQALEAWSYCLDEHKIKMWLKPYNPRSTAKTVGVISAGNLPLVGLHDCLCVLAAGFKLELKCSSDDEVLLPFILNRLCELEPTIKTQIEYQEPKLKEIDALIATGSDNAAKHFEFYFKNKAKIIRKNRSSVAILNGKESEGDLKALASDMFSYFGRGCRSVSKLFVPEGFNIQRIFENSTDYEFLKDQTKYANNFDYHRAIFLMNQDQFLENNFFVLKEEKDHWHAPVSVYYYEEYSDDAGMDDWIIQHRDQLQVVLDNRHHKANFGLNQRPELNQYADNVDTMAFLCSL